MNFVLAQFFGFSGDSISAPERLKEALPYLAKMTDGGSLQFSLWSEVQNLLKYFSEGETDILAQNGYILASMRVSNNEGKKVFLSLTKGDKGLVMNVCKVKPDGGIDNDILLELIGFEPNDLMAASANEIIYSLRLVTGVKLKSFN